METPFSFDGSPRGNPPELRRKFRENPAAKADDSRENPGKVDGSPVGYSDSGP